MGCGARWSGMLLMMELCLVLGCGSGHRVGSSMSSAVAESGSATSPLVVFTYGNGCPGTGSGNGLREVAEEIRGRLDCRVITRGCDDRDDIVGTIRKHAGPVILVGHSFGGGDSVKLAGELHRPVDGLVLLDPVARGNWGFSPGGQHFRVPESVKRAFCYYRPGASWPASFPIVNPAPGFENHPRRMGHNDFCSDGEVRRCILAMAAGAKGEVEAVSQAE